MITRILNVLYVLFLTPAVASACSVCFSKVKDDPQNIALRSGVIFMLGVVGAMMALCVAFFIKVGRSSRIASKG